MQHPLDMVYKVSA